jgi:hypothetical protein
LSTTLGPWCHFPRVGSPFLANGCSKSNKGLMVKPLATSLAHVEKDHARYLFYINQIGYLKDILKHFRMEDYKTIKVPLDLKTKLKKDLNKDCAM